MEGRGNSSLAWYRTGIVVGRRGLLLVCQPALFDPLPSPPFSLFLSFTIAMQEGREGIFLREISFSVPPSPPGLSLLSPLADSGAYCDYISSRRRWEGGGRKETRRGSVDRICPLPASPSPPPPGSRGKGWRVNSKAILLLLLRPLCFCGNPRGIPQKRKKRRIE